MTKGRFSINDNEPGDATFSLLRDARMNFGNQRDSNDDDLLDNETALGAILNGMSNRLAPPAAGEPLPPPNDPDRNRRIVQVLQAALAILSDDDAGSDGITPSNPSLGSSTPSSRSSTSTTSRMPHTPRRGNMDPPAEGSLPPQ
jgi:hypothetical protein